MSGPFKNPLAINNLSRKPSTSKNNHKRLQIIVGEVINVIYDGPKQGLVYFKSSEYDKSDIESFNDSSNCAFPLFPNIKIYPVKGESVIILRTELGSYYLSTINLINNINSNQLGSLVSFDTDIDNKKIDSNETFSPSTDIITTKLYEGDVVIEGRFGQSMKFGSTNKTEKNISKNIYSKSSTSKNGDPITIFRNDAKSSTENLVADGTSIYMCSTQKIQFDNTLFEGIFNDWSTININNVNVQEATITNTPENNITTSVTITPNTENNVSNQVDINTSVLSESNYEQITPSGPIEVVTTQPGYIKKPYNISKEGFTKLIQFEGSRNQVYDDKTGSTVASFNEIVGYPTIGVGHRIKESEYIKYSTYLKGKNIMSTNDIQKLLLDDLQPKIIALNNLIQVDIKQNMFDALIQMGFNTGFGNKFFKSAIQETNNKNFHEAAKIIRSGPITSKGQIVQSLVSRRNEEANLYLA